MKLTRRQLRNLIVEQLTAQDKKEIRNIARQEAQRVASKDEIERVFKKQFDAELKKSLGVSFIGKRGKINKFVQDAIEAEVKKMFADDLTKNQIADIAKEVVKKLYRELGVSSTQIIDRIKL